MKTFRTAAAAMLSAAALILGGCGSLLNTPVGVDADAAAALTEQNETADFFYEITAKDALTKEESAVLVSLDDLGSTVPDGCSYEDGNLVIQNAGCYLISGRLDGEIIVDTFSDDMVHLCLNGVEINAAGSPAVYVKRASKAVLTAMEGTQNIFSDSHHEEEGQKGCICAECSITLNGPGSFLVYGYDQNGIWSSDELKIVQTNLSVKAKKNALRGKHQVIVYDSQAQIESEKDGIHTESDDDLAAVQGGTVTITSGRYGISAMHSVLVKDTECTFYTTLGEINCDGQVKRE